MECLIKSIGKFGQGERSSYLVQEARYDLAEKTIAGYLFIETYQMVNDPNFSNGCDYRRYDTLRTIAIENYQKYSIYGLCRDRIKNTLKQVNERLEKCGCDLQWSRSGENLLLERIRVEEVEEARKKVRVAKEGLEKAQGNLDTATNELKKATAELDKLLPKLC